MSGHTGELAVTIARRPTGDGEQTRSVVAAQRHAGALRVLRPLYPDHSGQAGLTIVNPGGGYLGGDRYRLDVRLEEGAELLLTTQSATKIYRTPQGPAVSEQRIVLGKNARLEFVPDSVIAYRDASYHQHTTVDMDASSSLVLAEVVTHGWSPSGEPFGFDRVATSTRVVVDGRLLVTDRLLIEPRLGGVNALTLGGYSHLASLLVVDPRGDDEAVASLREVLGVFDREGSDAGPLVGVTRLDGPGFMARILARSTPEAARLLHAAVDWMRATWHGQKPLSLRKP